MNLIRFAVVVTATVALGIAAASAAELKGKSTTQGGSKPFCKGSTSISGSINGDVITIATPLSAGGTAVAKGRIDRSGSFKASGQRFTFSGTARKTRASGNWKGPSCYGTFSLRG